MIWVILAIAGVYPAFKGALKDPTSFSSLITFGGFAIVIAAIILIVLYEIIVFYRRRKLEKHFQVEPDALERVLTEQEFIVWMINNPANKWFRRRHPNAFVFSFHGTWIAATTPVHVMRERAITYVACTKSRYNRTVKTQGK